MYLCYDVRVSDPKSGRSLEIHTTQPGVQFYTSNFLTGQASGKGGCRYQKYGAFSLETQNYPDAVNQVRQECGTSVGWDNAITYVTHDRWTETINLHFWFSPACFTLEKLHPRGLEGGHQG